MTFDECVMACFDDRNFVAECADERVIRAPATISGEP